MSGSVSFWIAQLKAGAEAGAERLWEGYFDKLVRLARQHLRAASRAVADEEDVALSAFDSFCRGAEQGRFPKLDDRDDLWQLLVVITLRKTRDLHEHQTRKKRDSARTRSLSAEGPAAGETLVSREPSPAFAAEVAEEVQRLLGRLGSAELRQVALWKMEGRSNGEIAGLLGCVERTVERKLWVIRETWEGESSEG
jgi:DNA-directed RNA polymerase specialized sigma24 family protein